MYKTKLQEVCQQRHWGFPKYSSMKDGPDHNPRFKASVSVAGLSFDSPALCNSSKGAHNQAALLAYLHFTSPPPSGSPDGERYSGKNDQSHECESKMSESNSHKIQQQNCTQRTNLDDPLYLSTGVGPSDATPSNALVTDDGQTFESPLLCKTFKEGDHATAKDDSVHYKNLLQELAQREGFHLPAYKTLKFGTSHMPAFFSRVDVEGEIFSGKAGKSKKQAEQNAAKVAYSILKERALSRSLELKSPSCLKGGTSKTTELLDLVRDIHLEQSPKHGTQLLSSSTSKNEECDKQTENNDKEIDIAERLSFSDKLNILDSNRCPEMARSGKSDPYSCSDKAPSALVECQLTSSTSDTANDSAILLSNSNMGNTTEKRSYLLCNRFRVYSYYPDVPNDITVLPISDNKWVAVSLQFPAEVIN